MKPAAALPELMWSNMQMTEAFEECAVCRGPVSTHGEHVHVEDSATGSDEWFHRSCFREVKEGMTFQTLHAVIAHYQRRFGHHKPEQASGQWSPHPHHLKPHVMWMLEEMKKFGDDDYDKAMRWLGFVQGVLWVDGGWSIDQMRAHNTVGKLPVLEWQQESGSSGSAR
jgi:hypothetical protein